MNFDKYVIKMFFQQNRMRKAALHVWGKNRSCFAINKIASTI